MFSRFICHEGQRWLSQDAPKKEAWVYWNWKQNAVMNWGGFCTVSAHELVCVSVCLPFSLSLRDCMHIYWVQFCLVLPIFLVLILILSAHNCCPGPKPTSWHFNSVPKANLLRLWISSVLNSKRTERGCLLLSSQTHRLAVTTSLIGHL